MRRRDFIGLLGGAAVTSSLAARAQQQATPLIGFLHGTSPETRRAEVIAFHGGLSEPGYVEDQNVAVEYRWAEGKYDRLPALAADLVDRRDDHRRLARRAHPIRLLGHASAEPGHGQRVSSYHAAVRRQP